jgi:hypothetical protein
MPVIAVKRGDKYRVVEKPVEGRVKIAKNKAGTAADGGGHSSKEAAQRQARAINRSLKRAGKI